jgi:hypothetical protein
VLLAQDRVADKLARTCRRSDTGDGNEIAQGLSSVSKFKTKTTSPACACPAVLFCALHRHPLHAESPAMVNRRPLILPAAGPSEPASISHSSLSSLVLRSSRLMCAEQDFLTFSVTTRGMCWGFLCACLRPSLLHNLFCAAVMTMLHGYLPRSVGLFAAE